MRLGFVHTVPALAATFESDLVAARPGASAVHIADASLLARAIADGGDAAVDAALTAHVRHLASAGAAAVLVTCSSIGEATDRVAGAADVPVVRIDTAMATEAVAAAGTGRILVLATLEATLGPTGRLLAAVANAGADAPDVSAHLVAGAAQARAEGDQARHDALIADAVARADADVIVVAQASMAPAAEAAAGARTVLSSPASALATLLAAVEAAS